MSLLERTDLKARMFQGAATAVALTTFRLLFSRRAPSGALSLSTIAALLGVCAIAGALGGAFYFVTEPGRAQGGWRRTAANVGSLLTFCAIAVGGIVLLVWTGLLVE